MTATSFDLDRVRLRARVTHLKLSEGLIEEAIVELAHLLDELGDGLNSKSPKGGGRPRCASTASQARQRPSFGPSLAGAGGPDRG